MPKIIHQSFMSSDQAIEFCSQLKFWDIIKAGSVTHIKNVNFTRHHLIAQDETGFNALHIAVILQQEEMVHWLLSQHCQLEAPSTYQWTALHLAAQGPSDAIVNALLVAGANILAIDTLGWTPLHIAMYTNNLSIAQKLIEHYPAALDYPSSLGCYPLDLVANMLTKLDFQSVMNMKMQA